MLNVALENALVLGMIVTGTGAFTSSLRAARSDQSSTAENPAVPTRLAQVTNPKEFVGRIADHISGNYAHLRTIRGIIQTTSLDRTVTKREEVTINQDNGSRVQFVREPSSVRRQRLLLSGVDMRREATDEAGEIWSFHRGVYTQCTYRRRRLHGCDCLPQMPGIPPLDPRNIASLEQRWNFVDRLRGDRVIELVPRGPPMDSPGWPH